MRRQTARQQSANEPTFDDLYIFIPKEIMDMHSHFADQIEAEEAPPRAEINFQQNLDGDAPAQGGGVCSVSKSWQQEPN
jgi:hypothetical protein